MGSRISSQLEKVKAAKTSGTPAPFTSFTTAGTSGFSNSQFWLSTEHPERASITLPLSYPAILTLCCDTEKEPGQCAVCNHTLGHQLR